MDKDLINQLISQGVSPSDAFRFLLEQQVEADRQWQAFQKMSGHVCHTLGVQPEDHQLAMFLGFPQMLNIHAIAEVLRIELPEIGDPEHPVTPFEAADHIRRRLRQCTPDHLWGND